MADFNGPAGTPALLRTHNQRALLERLRRDGPLSRADLARRSGLSKPTVSQALADLDAAGLVRVVGPAAPSRGRTAPLYEPAPRAGDVDSFVWIELGTGVGAGIIINGELYPGARGAAGEVAYVPLPGNRGPARSGRGTLEEATSAAGVVAAAKAAGMRGQLTAKRV